MQEEKENFCKKSQESEKFNENGGNRARPLRYSGKTGYTGGGSGEPLSGYYPDEMNEERRKHPNDIRDNKQKKWRDKERLNTRNYAG